MARCGQRRNAKSFAAKHPRNTQPNPAGRVDIALSRLLEFAVHAYADVPVRAVYTTLQPQINMALSAVTGPRTQVGVTARGTIAAIHAVVRTVDAVHADAQGKKKGAA